MTRQRDATEESDAANDAPEDDADDRPLEIARMLVKPATVNGRGVYAMDSHGLGDSTDLGAVIQALQEQIQALKQGDADHIQSMLLGQATALQALYTKLVEKAMDQSHLDNLEALLRVALKAQTQSRVTLEALAGSNSRMAVYTRQANISNGPQQVNNGTEAPSDQSTGVNPQNEVLEDRHGERLDPRTSGSASCPDSELETVGGVDRTRHG